jgi:protein-L-isoaspartate(D-aspartate) O-methyltransferase
MLGFAPEPTMTDPLADLRRRYAEEIFVLAGATHEPIRNAYAKVPRERFCGPGPWTVWDAAAAPRPTPDADPAHLYANVLVSLDAAKSLNNGEPRFWAWLFERLKPMPGERILHVGAGTGYYTAILAEMAGPAGSVTGIEYEPELAERARAGLGDRHNVQVLQGDARTLASGRADIIVASCGFDAVPVRWVRMLKDGGRLLIPLTAGSPWPGIGGGAMLLVTHRGGTYEATFAGAVMIYHDMSGRTPEATGRLAQALGFQPGQPWTPPQISSLRLEGKPDDTCWLAGEGWWISTAPSP